MGWTDEDKPPTFKVFNPSSCCRQSEFDKSTNWTMGPWHHCLSTFDGAPKPPGKHPNSWTLPDPRIPFQPHPLPELISPGCHVSATSDKQPCSLTAWNALLPPLPSRLLSSTGTIHVSASLWSLPYPLLCQSHRALCNPVTIQSQALWLFASYLPHPIFFLPWYPSPCYPGT